MKWLIKFTLFCLLFFMIFTFVSSRFKKNHNIEYTLIGKQYHVIIDEKKIIDKNEISSYKFTVNILDEKFEFSIMDTVNPKREVIKEIKYIKDSKYTCILPIFKDEVRRTDIICKDKKENYYNYNTITESSEKLDKFVLELGEKYYSKNDYKEKLNSKKVLDTVTFYSDNLPDDIEFYLTSYKGIYLFEKDDIKHVNIFNNDVYKRELRAILDGKYVVANYDEKYDFHEFYVIDLSTGKKETIKLDKVLPRDSYVTGVVDNTMYIIDQTGKIQYKFNLGSKKLKEIGNNDSGMQYYNEGKWEVVPAIRFTANKTYFNNSIKKEEKDFTKFLETNGSKTGYNYFYKKEKENYLIYRSLKDDDKKIYLFVTDNLNSVLCTNNYVFYKIKNEIHYYSDVTGNRTLIYNSEIEFNRDIHYGAFEY